MKRVKKIRGLRRRAKDIERWKQHYLHLDVQHLLQRERHFAKIWVSHWTDLNLTNSTWPYVPSQYRNMMMQGLVEIYQHWEKQLQQLNQPYYLKIWLFEPRFIKSQVVCAIGKQVDFYNNTFNRHPTHPKFPTQKFRHCGFDLSVFEWVPYLDEDDVYDDYEHIRFIKRGVVWVGG